MGYEELKAKLEEWLGGILWGNGAKFRFEQFEGAPQGRVTFCTAMNTYTLSFKEGGLGCVVSSRIQRAGETWTRGNDLHDGPFSRETFDAIMRDIIGYELVVLEKEQELGPATPVESEAEAVAAESGGVVE